MKRSSQYFGLKYVVQCNTGLPPCFEPIAAFNHDDVANGYADDCTKANPKYVYRVQTRNGRGQFVTTHGKAVKTS